MRFAVIGLLALGGLVWAADLNETYKNLKEAFEMKDYAKVKTLSAQTAKEAQELAKEAQPSDASQVESWKGRQQFAKEAQTYAEYTLAVSATQAADPALTIELTEALIAQNPKSEQIDTATAQYLAALGKQGAAKANAAASKISPVCRFLLLRRWGRRLRLVRVTGAAGVIRISAAVSRAASIWSDLRGLALMATRKRLVREGKCAGGRLSFIAASPAQMTAIATSSAPTAPNAQNCP